MKGADSPAAWDNERNMNWNWNIAQDDADMGDLGGADDGVDPPSLLPPRVVHLMMSRESHPSLGYYINLRHSQSYSSPSSHYCHLSQTRTAQILLGVIVDHIWSEHAGDICQCRRAWRI